MDVIANTFRLLLHILEEKYRPCPSRIETSTNSSRPRPTDGRCPTCRTQDQEIKLRPNPIVQELVDLFQAARPEILQLGEDVKVFRELSGEGNGRGKRKLENTDVDDVRGEAGRKRTRS